MEKDPPRWLLLNQDCEVSVYSGPHNTQLEFVDALAKMINDLSSGLESDGDSTAHILTISEKGVPDVTDFSNSFMDAARAYASGDYCGEDEADLGIETP